MNQTDEKPVFEVQKDAMGVVKQFAHQFRAGFICWLEDTENVRLYIEFEKIAKLVASRGRSHYSARTIIEVIRHETVVGGLVGAWKINNNAIPDISRLCSLMNPELEHLFDFRTSDSRISGD